MDSEQSEDSDIDGLDDEENANINRIAFKQQRKNKIWSRDDSYRSNLRAIPGRNRGELMHIFNVLDHEVTEDFVYHNPYVADIHGNIHFDETARATTPQPNSIVNIHCMQLKEHWRNRNKKRKGAEKLEFPGWLDTFPHREPKPPVSWDTGSIHSKDDFTGNESEWTEKEIKGRTCVVPTDDRKQYDQDDFDAHAISIDKKYKKMDWQRKQEEFDELRKQQAKKMKKQRRKRKRLGIQDLWQKPSNIDNLNESKEKQSDDVNMDSNSNKNEKASGNANSNVNENAITLESGNE
ncbi:MAG: hypothetical protein ACPG2Y_02175, partial [Acholeplasmataceae bacterium]